jgi:two-component system heavy metal sensor histidine kinase CusS
MPDPRPRLRSLATRLALWYAASAFGLVLAATGYLYWTLASSLEREQLEFLGDKLYTLGVVLATDSAEIEKEVEQEWAGGPDATLFVRLLDESGATLAETAGMAGLGLGAEAFPEPAPPGRGLGPGRWRGAPGARSFELRALRLPRQGDAGSTCVAQIASDRTEDETLLAATRRRVAMVLVAALVACALGGFGLARQGLRPVSRIGATLRRIRSTTLHERIAPAGLPTELQGLAWTSNEMLDGLERAFRQLSRFSADIAHELRTPIHNLRGEIEVALARPRPPEEYRNLLGSCLEECTRLSRLIDSLLFLARAEGRAQALRRQALDLGEELGAIAEFYEPLAAEAGVELRVAVEPGTCATLDRSLLQSAAGNLIENAIAATGRGGRVTLASRADAGGVRVEVSDTGRGIAAAHLPHLFERLYRVDGARGGGAGLGLSIVQSIASLHGGSVSLASEVGVGTRVGLWFPATGGA